MTVVVIDFELVLYIAKLTQDAFVHSQTLPNHVYN